MSWLLTALGSWMRALEALVPAPQPGERTHVSIRRSYREIFDELRDELREEAGDGR